MFDKDVIEVNEISAPKIFSEYPTMVTSKNAANNNGFVAITIGNGAVENFNMTEPLVLSLKFKVKSSATPGAKAELVKIDTEEGYYFQTVDSKTVTAPTFNKTSISGTVVSKLSGTLAITGATAPVKNAAPVTSVTAPANTTATIAWYDVVSGESAPAKFAANTQYKAEINIKPDANYVCKR